MTARAPAAAAAARRRLVAVWAPWVCAPAFILLPIAGCGVAETLRRPAAVTDSAAGFAVGSNGAKPRLVPIAAVVTVLPPRR
jgi:hypothetical protein